MKKYLIFQHRIIIYMMRLVIPFLLVCMSLSAYSQKKVEIYYDRNWKLTSKDFAEYIRECTIDTSTFRFSGEVKDFYKSGSIQMIGKYRDNVKIDTFLFYYPSGNLKTSGYYKDNTRWGIWTTFYENGKIRDKIVMNDQFLGVLEYYDIIGTPKIVNGTGKWDFKYFNDFIYSLETVFAEFKDTLRHGTWNYYTSEILPDTNKNRLTCTEVYENGKYLSGKYYWGGGTVENLNAPVVTIFPESIKFQNTEQWKVNEYISKNDYPYLKFLPDLDSTLLPVDVYALFPGGLDSLLKTFQKNIKISKSDIKEKRRYMCLFKILIDKNGRASIIEDLNKTSLLISPQKRPFYLQTKKIVKNLPNWEPAKRDYKNVPCHYTLTLIWEDGNFTINLTSPNKENPFKNLFPISEYL